MILTNNHIPHISIFITAPFERRVQRAMEMHPDFNEKKAKHMLRQLDRQHESYYRFYTGRRWGNADNYDLCINSSAYGIEGSVDFILRMLKNSEELWNQRKSKIERIDNKINNSPEFNSKDCYHAKDDWEDDDRGDD